MTAETEPKENEELKLTFDDFIILISERDYENIENALKSGNFDVNWEDFRGATVLHYAAELGDMSLVKIILNQPTVKINVKTIEIMSTPLMLAAGTGKSEVVSVLLEKQANATLQNASGNTALMLAASGGHLKCVEELLKVGTERINIFATDNRNFNALMLSFKYPEITKILLPFYESGWDESERDIVFWLACSESNVETVSVLLEQNLFNLNMKDEDGNTPLDYAILPKNWSVVEFLLSMGAEYDTKEIIQRLARFDDTETFLIKCKFKEKNLSELFAQVCINNRIKVLKHLVQKYSDINELKEFGLHFAAQGGNTLIIKYLVENMEPNITQKTLLDAAVESIAKRNYEGFRYLFDKLCEKMTQDSDSDVEVCQNIMQMSALEHGFHEACEVLIRNSPFNIEMSVFESALFMSAAEGNLKMLKFLVKQGADVNAKDPQFGSPLLLATTNNHLDSVNYLIKMGADPTITDDRGFFPLLSAAYYGHKQVFSLLLRKDIEGVNRSSSDWITPLLAACRSKNPKIFKGLVNNGAKIDALDERGWNVLHFTFSESSFQEFAPILIGILGDRFAELAHAKDVSGKTPLDLLLSHKPAYPVINFIYSNEKVFDLFEAPRLQILTQAHDDICSICRDNLEDGDRVVVLPCKHIFHDDCHKNLDELSAVCPYCRKPQLAIKMK